MFELKINFKFFNLNLFIGNKDKLPNPWFTLKKSEKEVYEESEEEEDQLPHSSVQSLQDELFKTQISDMANKYSNELRLESLPTANGAAPPCGTSAKTEPDVTSSTSGSIFLHEIGDKHSDELARDFKELPDVEIIDNEYEKRLINTAKLVNQRYATYKETHGID